jgi:D-alanine transaminase
LTVYATARSFEPKTGEQEKGISVVFVPDLRWARTDIKSVGLLPNVLAHNQALENGASEAVFVRDGSVTEGTHSNFFAVIGGTVTTRPRTNYILGGITRLAILELCQKLSLPYQERSIPEGQAKAADELFIAGTTVEITPVVKVDGKRVASGRPGPVTRQLQEAFRKLT